MTVKRKIMRIMDLVMEISPPDVTYHYEEKAIAYASFSGYSLCLRVTVYEKGWNHDPDTIKKFAVFNLDSKEHAKKVNQELDEIIHYLEKLRRR